jgi:hypothetical protein
MRVKHADMKQEEQPKDESRVQPAFDYQDAKTGTLHSIERTLGVVLLGSYRSPSH